MTPDDIQAICAQVLADRALPLPPLTAPLPLTFRGPPHFPRTPADLKGTALRQQLVAIGQDGIGLALSPEALLGEIGQEEGLSDPEIWDVLDAEGALAYRVWIYGTDNGTVFLGDTIRVVAGCSQGGLESRAPGLAEALRDAKRRIPADRIPKASCIRFFGR